ncbi:MAG: ABC transporter substrate-binding protein [Chloroflexi bacterium]|nr:ABC transporter substrate-binding protein [Chloroflexota bacterium]
MNRRRALALGLALATLFAACGGAASPSPTTPVRQALTVGLGYIPSVQFAPFYLADQAGYYRDAGLRVNFQNNIDPDLVTLVGQGSVDVGLADGTSLIPAVSQGIPVRYIATIYRDFPSIVFAKTTSGIAAAADLKGRKIGIPGRYGSSWIMLQALLGSAGLTPDDVTIVEYPDYGQGAAVQQDAVDAATGFVNNEPIQLARAGVPTTILRVDQIVPLPGPGLISGTATLAAREPAIAAFVKATLKAMADIVTDPEKGLDATFAAVPDLASDRDGQKAILEATIAAWQGASGSGISLGTIDSASWTASLDYMVRLGLVPNPVTVEDLVRSDLLPD